MRRQPSSKPSAAAFDRRAYWMFYATVCSKVAPFLNEAGDGLQTLPPGLFSSKERAVLEATLAHPGGVLEFRRVIAAGLLWVRSGMPQFIVAPGLASSLMATSMAPDAADSVCLPFDAFLIRVPVGLIEPVKGDSWVDVMVSQRHGRIYVECLTLLGNVVRTRPRLLSELASLEDDDDDAFPAETELRPLERTELRSLLCVDRLILGVCAELSAPEAARAIAATSASTAGSRCVSTSPVPAASPTCRSSSAGIGGGSTSVRTASR